MKRVITYGTYDLLHYGHIALLRRARALGDFDVQAARREVLEVDPAPVLENLAWIRGWITRFLR